jgi:uroporphyrinogen decarboxylase
MKQGVSKMDRREIMLGIAENRSPGGYIPAGFFLHFDSAHHRGQAAVERHLEYFRHTRMDFMKIQYEHPFPSLPEIRRPRDWAKVPRHGPEYFTDPLEVISGIVTEAKKDALVIVTLYSALMLAGHAVGREQLTEHLEEDPESTAKGLRIIAESLLVFVQECVKLGVDGFYASTQGGEAGRFSGPSIFENYIKPNDLLVMREINRTCPFNILHICDYHGVYDDLSPYLDYPGHVVNCGTRLQSGPVAPRAIAAMFARPFMGGMDRHGILVSGTHEEIGREVRTIIRQAPAPFVLGADCTVPSDTSWDNLRIAIEAAHSGG